MAKRPIIWGRYGIEVQVCSYRWVGVVPVPLPVGDVEDGHLRGYGAGVGRQAVEGMGTRHRAHPMLEEKYGGSSK